MKRLLSLLYPLLVLLGTGLSQQIGASDVPASPNDIEKLLTVLHVRERTELITENSRQQFKTMAAEMLRKELLSATDQERARFESMLDEMVDNISKDYPVDAILRDRDMVPVYQRHLSKSDAEALIAFYSSPVGQKLLRELPAITTEAMQVSNAHIQPRMELAIDKLKQRVEETVQDDDKAKKAPTSTAEPGPKS
ncbi:MAG: DUF2059 domain-containing protein [Candidatus Sulfotelmatobacter sp.]